jgi:4-amino-4-deoxy-L-arabinose transferase-like glycosyltransferase
MVQRARAHLDKLALALVFAVVSTSTILWTIKDRTPPPWDPADHISQGYDYYRWFVHLNFSGFAHDFFSEPHYYAPLVHLITACIFVVFQPSRLSGIGVNLISLAALLWSVSWIAQRLYSRDLGRSESPPSSSESKAGDSGPVDVALSYPAILAPILVACYHFTAWLAHDAFLDYPLTAITAVAFALLIRAGNFTRRSHALSFGTVAGLGLLTKQTFPFFFLLPSLYVTFQVLLSRNRQAIMNLFLAVLAALVIAAVWYAPHFPEVIEIYAANRRAAIAENEAPLFSFMSNATYLHGLVSMQTQVPLGLLFVFGLGFSLIRRRRESLMLYLWLLSGLASFTIIANKDLRYTVPVLPAVALLSVSWMGIGNSVGAPTTVRPRSTLSVQTLVVTKRFCFLCIAAWSLISFFNAQWPRSGSGWFIDTPRFRWMVFARNYFDFDHRPLTEDWSVPKIVETVASLGANHPAALMNPPGQAPALMTVPGSPLPQSDAVVSPSTRDLSVSEATRPVLGVVVNLPHLNPSAIALNARLMSEERGGAPLIKVEWLVESFAADRIERCDYILVRTGLDQADWVSPMERYVKDLMDRSPERFSAAASFPIPVDQAQAIIYRLQR